LLLADVLRNSSRREMVAGSGKELHGRIVRVENTEYSVSREICGVLIISPGDFTRVYCLESCKFSITVMLVCAFAQSISSREHSEITSSICGQKEGVRNDRLGRFT